MTRSDAYALLAVSALVALTAIVLALAARGG